MTNPYNAGVSKLFGQGAGLGTSRSLEGRKTNTCYKSLKTILISPDEHLNRGTQVRVKTRSNQGWINTYTLFRNSAYR